MPRVDIVRSSEVKRTPRVIQMEGMFEIPPSSHSEQSCHAECLPAWMYRWAGSGDH
jgi:hypothetical protein